MTSDQGGGPQGGGPQGGGPQGGAMSSDPQNALRLSREVFTPALQGACRMAQEQGASMIDLVNAVADAYFGLLAAIVGEKGAIDLMQAHAQDVARLGPTPPR